MTVKPTTTRLKAKHYNLSSGTITAGVAFINPTALLIKGGDIMRISRDRIQEWIDKTYGGMLGSARFGGGGGDSSSSAYARGHADGGGLAGGQRRIG